MGTVSYLPKIIPQPLRVPTKRIVKLNARQEPQFQTFTEHGQIGPLVFRCPASGCGFESGIEMDMQTFRRTRHLSVHLRCPACDRPHELTVADGRLASYRSR